MSILGLQFLWNSLDLLPSLQHPLQLLRFLWYALSIMCAFRTHHAHFLLHTRFLCLSCACHTHHVHFLLHSYCTPDDISILHIFSFACHTLSVSAPELRTMLFSCCIDASIPVVCHVLYFTSLAFVALTWWTLILNNFIDAPASTSVFFPYHISFFSSSSIATVVVSLVFNRNCNNTTSSLPETIQPWKRRVLLK